MLSDGKVRTWTVQQYSVDTIVAILADWVRSDSVLADCADVDAWFRLCTAWRT
ncbi:hypothetical protein FKP32DRAFT_1586741 [Trametes sanguinea]|nr:hypothetical protein FKP32DRAFT_1586741 [Trametes sanguinea]